MTPKRKMLPYLLAFSLIPLLAFVGQDLANQPPLTPAQEKAAKGITSEISRLRYTTASGQDQVVEAKTLIKIQLIQSADANSTWLELFFINGDYVFVKTDSLTLYAGGRGIPTTKVLVARVTRDRISFPRLIP